MNRNSGGNGGNGGAGAVGQREGIPEHVQWIADIRASLRSDRLAAAYTILAAIMPHAMDSPELNNLLGVYYEKIGDIIAARKRYRIALVLEPAYAPARRNQERLTVWKWHQEKNTGDCDLGDAAEADAAGLSEDATKGTA